MSLEMDITAIRKMMKEATSFMVKPPVHIDPKDDVETEPITKPDTKPDTAPKPHRDPWEPEPGISPKPKAMVKESIAINPSVELFFKRRGKAVPAGLLAMAHGQVTEADENTEEYADPAVDKGKMDWIQTGGSEKIKQLMPGTTDAQVEYVTTIASETYNDLVNRIRDYTGIKFTKKNVPQLYGLLMDTLQKTIGWESRNKERLEELALDLVLSIPEYKVAEVSYSKSRLKFDAKIDSPDLRRLLQAPQEPEQPQEPVAPEEAETQEGLEPDEKLEMEMVDIFKDIHSEEDLRRKFANLMITGGTINKLYLYNLVSDRLNSIDPKLVNAYGILSAVVQMLYWVTPMGTDNARAGSDTGEDAAGSEEVVPDGDTYIIKARGKTFPFLVHEISKGISEWLMISKDMQKAGSYEKDTLEDETEDMMVGPGVYKTVVSYIPSGEQELIPLVQQKLLKMGPIEMKDVLGKTPKGKSIMNSIIQASRDEWEQSSNNREDYKES